MTRNQLPYGDERIEFEILYTPLRSSKIAIHVHPNATIQVDAPIGTSSTDIRKAVQKRARWIKKQVENASRYSEYILPRNYVSGECHFYLGRRYQLKIVCGTGNKPNVKLLRGQLRVETDDTSPKAIKNLLRKWYRMRADDVFRSRLEAVSASVIWLKEKPEWKLLTMRKQWGSCSPDGQILLNPHLVRAPRECVDYVITHELCHLREHNHSPRFYRHLSQLIPDWKNTKAKLDGMAELILNE